MNKQNIVLFVGRLTYADKRVDMLIDIWNLLKGKTNDWKLIIVGEGPEKENLEAQVKKLNLTNVEFAGFSNNPKEYYDKAAILCMTSVFEGWGLVLTEAQANGVVPMAFGCSEGVKYILSPHQINGLIIPPFDKEIYAQNLLSLMNNKEKRLQIQKNIIDSTFNVGIYTNVNEITTIKKVGLLNENQYKRAGGINSFLNIDEYFWLGNRHDNSQTRIVSGLDYVNVPTTHNYGVRAIIKINNIIVTEGEGTLTSSYKSSIRVTNINEIQVGEYINVPYNGNDNACGSDNMCSFRVVSKDNDSVKVILNGLLPNTSSYGSTSTITTNHTIYTVLNNFASNISNMYRYGQNKTFYIGDYPSSSNYVSIKDETLLTSVGLPSVGEMFCSNDIDMNLIKNFVDKNTIENSNLYGNFWTMNRTISTSVRVIGPSGGLGAETITNNGYVRPVIFLKNNLEFTGGDGTAQNPYTLD